MDETATFTIFPPKRKGTEEKCKNQFAQFCLMVAS